MCCSRDGAAAGWALPTYLSSWWIGSAASRDSTSSTWSWRHCWSPASKRHSGHDVTTDDCNSQQCCHGSSDSSTTTDDVTPRAFSSDTEVTAASKPCEWAHVALSETAPLQLQAVLQRQAETSLLTDTATNDTSPAGHQAVQNHIRFHLLHVVMRWHENVSWKCRQLYFATLLMLYHICRLAIILSTPYLHASCNAACIYGLDDQ